MDVEEGNKDLDDFEIKQLEKNQRLKDLIASTNRSFKTISVGEDKIKIKPYMPKKIRIELLKLSRALEEATPESMGAVEKRIYEIIASMCVEDPFDKPLTWEYVDNETGCIQDVLVKVASEIMKTDSDLKSFRGKQ